MQHNIFMYNVRNVTGDMIEEATRDHAIRYGRLVNSTALKVLETIQCQVALTTSLNRCMHLTQMHVFPVIFNRMLRFGENIDHDHFLQRTCPQYLPLRRA